MEPENALEKYVVAVIKDRSVVGHLMKGESGKFAKTFFLFPPLERTEFIHSCCNRQDS